MKFWKGESRVLAHGRIWVGKPFLALSWRSAFLVF